MSFCSTASTAPAAAAASLRSTMSLRSTRSPSAASACAAFLATFLGLGFSCCGGLLQPSTSIFFFLLSQRRIRWSPPLPGRKSFQKFVPTGLPTLARRAAAPSFVSEMPVLASQLL